SFIYRFRTGREEAIQGSMSTVSFEKVKRVASRAVEGLLDAAAVCVTYVSAIGVRTGGRVGTDDSLNAVFLAAIAGVLQVIGNLIFKVYWRSWHFAGLEDVAAITKAALIPAAFLVAVNELTEQHYVPTGSVLTGTVLVIVVETALRLRPRGPHIARAALGRRAGGPKMIVIGAGHTGQLFAAQLAEERSSYQIACFVDDDLRKHGSLVRGIPVC